MATLPGGGQGPMPPTSGASPTSGMSGASIAQSSQGLLSAAFDIYSGIMAHKAASEAARTEARGEGKLTAAKLSQLLQEERIMRGQTIAAAAGSGVKTGTGQYGGPAASPVQILNEQAKRFAEERKLVAESGATKSSAALQRGEAVGYQVMGQAFSSASSKAASAFSLWKTG